MARLILVTGPPGSGKSTLAKEVAARVGTVAIEMDEIRKDVFPDSDQSEEDRDSAYRCMHMVAQKVLEAGVGSVVMVATYARQRPREWLLALSERTQSKVYVIECKVSPELAAARFRSRAPGHPALDLTEGRVRRFAMKYPYGTGCVIDTGLSVEECLGQAEKYLRSGRSIDVAKWSRVRS